MTMGCMFNMRIDGNLACHATHDDGLAMNENGSRPTRTIYVIFTRFNNANQKLRTWRQAQCSWRLSSKYFCILTTQSFSNSCKKRILARICHAVESPVVPRSPSTGSALPIPRLGGAYRVNTQQETHSEHNKRRCACHDLTSVHSTAEGSLE